MEEGKKDVTKKAEKAFLAFVKREEAQKKLKEATQEDQTAWKALKAANQELREYGVSPIMDAIEAAAQKSTGTLFKLLHGRSTAWDQYAEAFEARLHEELQEKWRKAKRT